VNFLDRPNNIKTHADKVGERNRGNMKAVLPGFTAIDCPVKYALRDVSLKKWHA